MRRFGFIGWIEAYRSEAGGWCVRIGSAYFHVTGLFKWRRFA